MESFLKNHLNFTCVIQKQFGLVLLTNIPIKLYYYLSTLINNHKYIMCVKLVLKMCLKTRFYNFGKTPDV